MKNLKALSILRIIAFTLLSAFLLGFALFIAMVYYGGNHGCFAWADQLFNMRGYESCGMLGMYSGFILGGAIGMYLSLKTP